MPDEHSNTVVSAVGSVGGLHEASDSSVVAGKKRKVSEVAEDCLKVLKERKTGMLARWVPKHPVPRRMLASSLRAVHMSGLQRRIGFGAGWNKSFL